jgi:cell wall-associated NlpC family hydrolase
MSTSNRGVLRHARKLTTLSLMVALGVFTALPGHAAPTPTTATKTVAKKKPYQHDHDAHHGHKHGKYTHYHAAHHVKNVFGHTHGVHHAHKRGMKGHSHLDHHPIIRKRLARQAKKRANATRARVIRVARAQKGDPYRYGAAGPNAFDCSGLTKFVFKKAAGKRLPRTSRAQYGAAKRIPARAARPGDLVFFHGGSGVYHVGIYAGKHAIWHAPYSGSSVHRERIWTSAVSYGRVLR